MSEQATALRAANAHIRQEAGINDPPLIAIFGETNTAKSTVALEMVAGGGLILTQPGGATTGQTVLGVDIRNQVAHVSDAAQIPDFVVWAKAHGFTSVYIDDFTLIMHNTFSRIATKWAVRDVDGNVTGYDYGLYNELKPLVMGVVQALRWAGLPAVVTCHPQPAFVHKKQGNFPAGPDLGWKQLVKVLPCEADVSLHATGLRKPDGPAGPASPGAANQAPNNPWDFRCDAERGNPAIATGDRYDIAPPKNGPLNPAELIREAARVHGYNYHIPRPAGLEWMDDYAERIACDLLASRPTGHDYRPVTARYAQHLLSQGVHTSHIRWALKDGVHRYELRAARETNALAGLL